MNEVLSRILKTSTEIKTAFALAAFGIAAVLVASILRPVDEYQVVLYVCTLLALCYLVYRTTITPTSSGTTPSTETNSNIASQASIDLLINRSDLPMYLTDENMIVRNANRPLLDILDVSKRAILNEHVDILKERFLNRVPEHLRSDVDQEQNRLIEIAKDKTSAPRTQTASVIIDNRDVTGGAYKGSAYRVWIHSIWLKKDEASERMAALVLFFPFPLTDEDLQVEGL